VRIALIDGGVDFNHPWLLSKPGLLVSRWDYIDDDYLASEESGGSCSGHGTFVAGILRMVAPSSEIYVYRVLDTSGFGDGFSISEAVLKAIEDSCNIINLSLGMVGVHDGLEDALKLAKQQGIMIVASAGNDSTDLNSIFPFPASKEYCVAVAALDSIDRKADFSNYGLKIGLCAPGTWIYAPYPDNMYAWWDGTSFAAPFISASAALVKSKYPDMTMATIDTLLRETASNIDSLNITYEGLLGNGYVNLTAALDISYSVMRGDLSGDSLIDITDLSLMVAFLTNSIFSLDMYQSGDMDCDKIIDISDLSILVAFIEGLNPIICTNP
jgi:thermitase